MNISTRFTGCMTLTMRNKRNVVRTASDEILVVDVADGARASIPPELLSKATAMTNAISPNDQAPCGRGIIAATYKSEAGISNFDHMVMFRYAWANVERLARARLVVTSRIHAALPAMALGTDAVFLSAADLPGGHASRTAGLSELFPGAEALQDFHMAANVRAGKGLGSSERKRAKSLATRRAMELAFWDIAAADPALRDAAHVAGTLPRKLRRSPGY